jgi:hypothetical protein
MPPNGTARQRAIMGGAHFLTASRIQLCREVLQEEAEWRPLNCAV